MSDKANQAVTNGVHHIGLTVPDLEKTRTFFLETLSFEQVGEVPDYPGRVFSFKRLSKQSV